MTARKISLFLVLFLTLSFLPGLAKAAFVGEIVDFVIDPSYDASARKDVSASLVKISSQLYVFVDDAWWSSQNAFEQTQARNAFDALAQEFAERIHPQLTQAFGSEWSPGIDGDERITVLFHPMKGGAGGYTNYGDEIDPVLNPNSNEREMVYLNPEYIGQSVLRSLLAHEFVHLITYNQKNRLQGLTEDTWLNEARAEYAPTLLGYDADYEGSNLQRRVGDFLRTPNDSLLQWKGTRSDYASVNLFAQYIVEQYGTAILQDSLKADTVGVESISKAFSKNGFVKNFDSAFADWVVAVLVNDCAVGSRYCYTSSRLKNMRVVAQTNFLPLTGESTLSLVQNIKDWSGNWYRIVGGKDVLEVEFRGNPQASFKVPYVVQDGKSTTVSFLNLDTTQKGTLRVVGANKSLTVLPFSQTNSSGQGEYQIALIASTTGVGGSGNQNRQEILSRIQELQSEIARLQAQLNAPESSSCTQITQNLFFGLTGSAEVSCLQQMLRDEGSNVYPEAIVSGNFLTLTRQAVVRFQEKYASEILSPLGLSEGTGFVGPSTRAKLNEILSR